MNGYILGSVCIIHKNIKGCSLERTVQFVNDSVLSNIALGLIIGRKELKQVRAGTRQNCSMCMDLCVADLLIKNEVRECLLKVTMRFYKNNEYSH